MVRFDEIYGPSYWTPCEALSEGWELFWTDHDDGQQQLTIQTLADYPTPFEADADAVSYVNARAMAGSDVHKRAMALHLSFVGFEHG